jgi:hypothetical protein
MFIRVRQKPGRILLSLVATSRQAGKVVHQHIAGLGSVDPLSVESRIAYWAELPERLAKLSHVDEAKILDQIRERVPEPTGAERATVRSTLRKLRRNARGHDNGERRAKADA